MLKRAFQAVVMLTAFLGVSAFRRAAAPSVSRLSARRSLAMAAAASPTKPTLYTYYHCPFCVRAMAIFGLKQIDYQVIYLDNDDVDTPTALVGKKVVPILDYVAEDGSRVVMPESMDIVKRIDEDGRFGAPILKPASNREDIKVFWDSITDLQRRLSRPRFARTSVLPEFRTAKARAAFVRNHPLQPPSDYEENFQNKALIEALNAKLADADKLIHSTDHVSPGGLSYDDIDFFGKFRGLTVIKGVKFPPKLLAYLENFSAKAEVPLFFQLSI